VDTSPCFPVEPELDTRHETFQRIFGRAKSLGAGRTLRLTVNANPHFFLKPEADSTGLFNLERFRGLILPLVAVVCLLSFSSSATAQTLADAPAAASVDGFDCITAYEVEEDSTQVCDIAPNPWNDLDEISLPLNDKAVIPSRYGQGTPQTTGTTLAPITLQPGFVPAFLFSTHSSDSMREHIRERAPPSFA
jgi:hypothetical protein